MNVRELKIMIEGFPDNAVVIDTDDQEIVMVTFNPPKGGDADRTFGSVELS